MLQIPKPKTKPKLISVTESYEYCRQITADYAKTFYLGTLLMPKEKSKAIWAIYAWCRRTDELVDGEKARFTTDETLARWENQLESVFAGKPLDDTDVALADVVQRFPMDIQPFRDMIAGQRMDLYRSRYQTFDELKLYCYRVAGTVGLMSNAVLGIRDHHTNIPWKREDAERGRIYLPLDDLAAFNYTEQDLLAGVNDERWKAMMRFQIKRARQYYHQAEKGISYLIRDSRLPVWASLMLYQGILGAIEKNNYDVFNKRAFVRKPQKIASLPIAWLRAQVL